MAALLEVNVMRAHQAPAAPLFALGLPAGPARPVLAAQWTVMPDGRLACLWHEQASAPPD